MVFIKDMLAFFTVHERKKRNGKWETRHIVSNMELSAKDYEKAYSKR